MAATFVLLATAFIAGEVVGPVTSEPPEKPSSQLQPPVSLLLYYFEHVSLLDVVS